MENQENLIIQTNENNEIQLSINYNNSINNNNSINKDRTFNKLRKLQKLIKKESGLKELCKKKINNLLF